MQFYNSASLISQSSLFLRFSKIMKDICSQYRKILVRKLFDIYPKNFMIVEFGFRYTCSERTMLGRNYYPCENSLSVPNVGATSANFSFSFQLIILRLLFLKLTRDGKYNAVPHMLTPIFVAENRDQIITNCHRSSNNQ